ncbi:MAG: hypothetical protein GMKNLPBB_01842 [Myxococcota bacterium]|nr:hypothetical protein [Myxococcota bacterium]
MHLESRRSEHGGLIVSLVWDNPEEQALVKHYPDLIFFETVEMDPKCVYTVEKTYHLDDYTWRITNMRWEAHIFPQNEDAYERFINEVSDRLEAMKVRLEEVDFFTRGPQLRLLKGRNV